MILPSYVETIFYLLMGYFCMHAGLALLKPAKDNKALYFSVVFWVILGLMLMAGPLLPPVVHGVLLIVLALFSFLKKVIFVPSTNDDKAFKEESAKKFGFKLIVPSLVVAVMAFYFAQFLKWNGVVALGMASVVGTVVCAILLKSKLVYFLTDGAGMVRSLGPSGILPQLLAVLGAIFVVSGVSDIFSSVISPVLQGASLPIAAVVYTFSMAIFTIFMGNSFGAFSVITVAIGYPFLIAKGANPAVVASLGLISGSAGTLLTPMAANFNIIPVSLLNIRDQNAVIKAQVPMSIGILIVNTIAMIILM